MTRRCSEYDGLNAKKAIKGAFGDGVMASHQLGALLWPTTALYYLYYAKVLFVQINKSK